MDIRNGRALRSESSRILARFPNHQKFVLLWAGLSAALSVLLTLLTLVLDSGIAGTGGLSGVGLRSILVTAQSVLRLAFTLAAPFWGLGYVYGVLQYARGEQAGFPDLLQGFRRFGPGLRLMLLEGLLYGALFLVCMNVGFSLLSLTPLAKPLLETLTPLMDTVAADPEMILDETIMASLTQAMLPMLIGCTLIYLAALIPISYRLRMAQFRLMDDPGCGAMEAVRESTRMTRGNCMALFKLDLGFWWFYLAEALFMIVLYGDVILTGLGIALPFSSTVSSLLFSVLSLVLQLVLYFFVRNQVALTYTLAYRSLRPEPKEPPVPHPWSK